MAECPKSPAPPASASPINHNARPEFGSDSPEKSQLPASVNAAQFALTTPLPKTTRLFVAPLIKDSHEVRLGARYVQAKDALPTDANYHRRRLGYRRRREGSSGQPLALLDKGANAPALSSLLHRMHPIANGQEMIHPALFHGQLQPKPGPSLPPC